MTRCRGPTGRRGVHDACCEPVVPQLNAGVGRCGSRLPADIFRRTSFPEAARLSRVLPRALGTTRTVEIPEPRAPAPRLCHHDNEAPRCILDRLRQRPNDFDPAVRDRLIAAPMIPAPLIDRAQKFAVVPRADDGAVQIRRRHHRAATPASRRKLGQATFVLDGVELPVRAISAFTPSRFSSSDCLCRVPVPLEPLPIGVQIIAAPGAGHRIACRLGAGASAWCRRRRRGNLAMQIDLPMCWPR